MPLPPRSRGWHGGFTSEEWLCRKVLPPHEAYWGHVAATPVASRRDGVSQLLTLSPALTLSLTLTLTLTLNLTLTLTLTRTLTLTLP